MNAMVEPAVSINYRHKPIHTLLNRDTLLQFVAEWHFTKGRTSQSERNRSLEASADFDLAEHRTQGLHSYSLSKCTVNTPARSRLTPAFISA